MKCITSDHSRQFGNIVGQSRCSRACHFRWFCAVDACSVWFKAKFEIQILKHENNLYILFALSVDLNGQLIKTWLSDDHDSHLIVINYLLRARRRAKPTESCQSERIQWDFRFFKDVLFWRLTASIWLEPLVIGPVGHVVNWNFRFTR
jgi:hypothetical protein